MMDMVLTKILHIPIGYEYLILLPRRFLTSFYKSSDHLKGSKLLVYLDKHCHMNLVLLRIMVYMNGPLV